MAQYDPGAQIAYATQQGVQAAAQAQQPPQDRSWRAGVPDDFDDRQAAKMLQLTGRPVPPQYQQ
jgi:hypothetical protein